MERNLLLASQPRALFIGRSTYDALYRVDALPEENCKLFARQFYAAPGGPALNAALTHAQLGGQALLVSAIGGGPWARAVRGELWRQNVRLLDLAEGTAYQTPLVCAWINQSNGSRTVVNPPAWPDALPPLPAHWSDAAPGWETLPPVVLTDGFHLSETLDFLVASHAAGAALCLDGGSWKPGTERLAPLLRVAICGERFAAPGTDGSPESTLAWFAAQGVPHVAVTRGNQSILCLDRGRHFAIDVAAIEPVDTLGAGDVLHGAFCYHYAQEPDFEAALRQAAAVATRSCLGLGITAWQPSS